jgi:hypothetical protein
MLVCDIDAGGVEILDDHVICGQTNSRHSGIVRVSGSTTQNTLSIATSTVILELKSVSVQQNSPFTVTASTVSIILDGVNQFIGTQSAAIACQDGSNLTFLSSTAGSVHARAPQDYAGIGTSPSAFCGSLLFVNGT